MRPNSAVFGQFFDNVTDVASLKQKFCPALGMDKFGFSGSPTPLLT